VFSCAVAPQTERAKIAAQKAVERIEPAGLLFKKG